MLIYYIAILFLIIKFLLASIYIMSIDKKLNSVNNIAVAVLVFDTVIYILSLFTNSFLVFYPYFLLINKNLYPFINISYMVISILLILPFSGVSYYFERLHRFIISIYFFQSIIYLLWIGA